MKYFSHFLLILSIVGNWFVHAMESSNKAHLFVNKLKTSIIDQYPALHKAIIIQDKKAVKKLINQFADVNESFNGIMPLHYACKEGNVAIVSLLLKAGAQANIPYRINNAQANKAITYPIHIATQFNHHSLIPILINHGASIDEVDNNHHTALHIAAKNGNKDMVQLLLDHKADPTCKFKYSLGGKKISLYPFDSTLLTNGEITQERKAIAEKLVNALDKNELSLLHYAASKKNRTLNRINRYLRHGAKINLFAYNRTTPLHFACRFSDHHFVELLLNNQADVNIQNNQGFTPLLFMLLERTATEGAPSEIEIEKKANILLKYKATLELQDIKGNTALHYATGLGLTNIVHLLLKHSADLITITNKQGHTTLAIAIQKNLPILVKLLIEHNARIHTVDKENKTPIHFAIHQAVKNKNLEILEILFSTPMKKDEYVESLKNSDYLHFALSAYEYYKNEYKDSAIDLQELLSFMTKVITLLVDQGIEINKIKEKGQMTPLFAACHANAPELVEFLLKKGADASLEIPNDKGIFPIHRAILNKNYSMVKILLNYNNRLAFQPTKYISEFIIYNVKPLHSAVSCGQKDIVKLLLEYGAHIDIDFKHSSNLSPLEVAKEKNFDSIIALLDNAKLNHR